MNTCFKRFLLLSAMVLMMWGPLVYADQLGDAQADRAALEQELSNLEAQIAEKQQQLNSQKGQSASLSRDINILTTQIGTAKLNIKSKTLTIQKLGGEIVKKNSTIQTLTQKIESEKESLAQLIRKNREIDDRPLLSLILSEDTISDAYGDVDAFASLNKAIDQSVHQISGMRSDTESEKKILEQKKNQETDIKVQLEKEKKQVEQNEKEKQGLLSISKNKEASYQAIIAEQQKRVGEIKARLFSLAGVSQAIRFDAALGYAEAASAQTSVAPAFLLAIITQESKLGANVGKCYLTDAVSGAGVSSTGKAWPNLMKPSRDVQPFMNIIARFGLDPYKTVVSCPIAGVAGYGGAMGPAQFIPSTWKLFESRITAITGSSNPWSPRDAFTASALYLSDLGAKGDSYTAQIKAACKYYGSGGSSCSYGKSVMKLRDSIQADIDYLKQYGISKR